MRHVTMWLQGMWCDAWFQGAHDDPKSFAITAISWSQIGNSIELFFDVINPAIPNPWVFLTLLWQGMVCLHHDRILHHVFPQLLSSLVAHMQHYFEKCHLVLNHTPMIPVLTITNHYLGYALCPPSVKQWLKHFDCAAFIMALPKFPVLQMFRPLTIDAMKDYSNMSLASLTLAVVIFLQTKLLLPCRQAETTDFLSPLLQ